MADAVLADWFGLVTLELISGCRDGDVYTR